MKALYITYDGLSDPLGQSQVLPYLKGLSSKSIEWTILSFEKNNTDAPTIKKINQDLAHHNILWIKVPYYTSIPLKIFSFIHAIFILIFRKEKYNLVHVRGYIAALLGLIIKKMTHSRFIFDMRGFWPDERVDGDLWKRNSLHYKFFKFLERHFIQNANTVVVLTEKAKKILEDKSQYPKAKNIVVIPTCVDILKFFSRKHEKISLSLCYSGSIGTWYCLEEMLSFFELLKANYSHATLTLLINWTSLQALDKNNRLQLTSTPGLKINSCSYNDLPNHLSSVHLGIFFIRPLPSKRASCPTKLGEFLAMGIPLIINRGIGDCDEWIEKEKLGILVDDFTLSSYQKALSQLPLLLEDKEISNRCVQFSQKHLSLQKGILEYKKIL